jgi:glycosyltransferase involved in cell wall biosynthesis
MAAVNLVADLSSDSSLGETGRSLLLALDAVGIPYHLRHTAYEFNLGSMVRDQSPPNLTSSPPSDITLIAFTLHAFAEISSDRRSTLTAAQYLIGCWTVEAPVRSPKLLEILDSVDEIWTPSTYSAGLLRTATRRPVFVIPHSVLPRPDPSIGRHDFGISHADFACLFAFSALSGEVRKNAFGLIAAFAAAARGHAGGRPPLLVLKVHHADRSPAYMKELRRRAGELNSLLITRSLSRSEMDSLTALSDCIVSLHRAEGFGLHLAEAMALGKPVVATRFSGSLDFMNDENSILVDCDVRSVPMEAFHFQPEILELFAPSIVWGEPRPESAAAALRQVFNDESSLVKIAAAARDHAAKHLTPKAVGTRILGRLSDLGGRGPHLRSAR